MIGLLVVARIVQLDSLAKGLASECWWGGVEGRLAFFTAAMARSRKLGPLMLDLNWGLEEASR